MSYILDALRKSEYARQQGRSTDLASLPPLAASSTAQPARQHLWRLGTALLLAIALTGWWRPWQSVPALPAPRAQLQELAGGARHGAEPLATQATALASATPSPVARSAPPATLPAPAQSTPLSAQMPALATLSSSRPQAVLPPPPPVIRPAAQASPSPANTLIPAQPATTHATAALPADPPRDGVVSFHELPAAVRERLPRLEVAGFSYTEQTDLRLAVINARVLRQGESAAPGVTLERIASDGVVLRFAGYRFRPQR